MHPLAAMLILVIAGAASAVGLGILYAAMILSGRISEQERQAYHDEFGVWPEW